jgi:transcriptional regulator with XRE-family HTH domain
VSPSSSTFVQRRRLRGELRKARQDAGLTQEHVAEQMDWSLSKIIRIETGSVGISTNDLTALLRLYNVQGTDRVRRLVELARAARQQSRWSKYRDSVPPAFFQFLEYEAAASVERGYESFLIPGLLQTEQYAATVISEYKGNYTPKTIRARVEIRMARQQFIEQPNSPRLHFILDEAVVQRLMGDKEARGEQLRKLVEMAARPHVTIEILPFSAGLHRSLGETFTILEFQDSADDDVLYFENGRDALFSHAEADEISLYREIFENLRSSSLGPRKSLAYLTEVATEEETR